MIRIIDGGIHVRHNDNFIMRRASGVPEYLLLLVKTDAIFLLDSKKIVVPPNSVVLIDRHTSYEYYNPHGEYVDDWLHFEAQESEYIWQFSPILNQFFYCRNLSQLETYLKQILWEKEYAAKKFKIENTELLLRTLINNLVDAYEQRDNNIQNNPYYRLFQELRLKIQANPKFTLSANEIAESFGISVSHFHHLYKDFFHSTYRNDFVLFRIEQTKMLLATTDLTIEEIIHSCGYKNATHFYRQFKHHVNLTPAEYRAVHLQNT